MPLKIGRFDVRQTAFNGTGSRASAIKGNPQRVGLIFATIVAGSLQVFLDSNGCTGPVDVASAGNASIKLSYKDWGDMLTLAFAVNAAVGQVITITEVLLNPGEYYHENG